MFLLLVFYDSKKIIYAVLSAISFLLSLLAKESTLPLILAIPVTFYFFRNSKLKTVFSYIVILLVPTIVYLVIRNQALGFLLNNDVNATGIMNDPYFDASFSQKIGTILYTLLIDIKLLFLPHPLTHDYYPYHIQLLQIFHPLSLLSVLLLGGLIWIAVKGIKTRNKISWIIFYFFVTISIVSNVVINVGAFTNERFLFVPSLAFSVLIIWLFEKFSKTKTILFAISALFIVGFALKSYTRIPVWENEKTLNKAAVLVSKNSARSNCFYGVSLYNEILKDSILEEKTAKIIEAQKYINRSLEIYPEYADALRMKAGLAGENYKIDRDADKVLAVFKEILEVRHLAFVDEFTNWLERRTDKNKMLQYYFDVGYANFAVKKQNFSWANFYLQKGFKLDPTNKNILFGNCIISYLTSDYKKSIEYGNSYLNIHGENAEMYFYLGNAQIKNGEPQTGRQNIEKAYQLKPELKNQKLN